LEKTEKEVKEVLLDSRDISMVVRHFTYADRL
jgi:hypothetical protein